jgi:broad specificity phosphatase PhoE
MQTILLIRHAAATSKEQWRQADHLRPLTRDGEKQALAIAEELDGVKIASIRSSPAVRCVQTVQPLATRAKIKLKVDEQLNEGSSIALPHEAEHGLHVYCAHGDNIPALLNELGIECQQCQKGSIWMLKRDDTGEITEVSYVQPPEEE